MIRALHIGKFIPPPYAGIESHIDTLLRALGPAVDATLVASRPVGHASDPLPELPYRLIPCTSYGTVASVSLSPGLPGLVQRELQRHSTLLHLHAPNPWGDIAALRASSDVPVVMTWHSDIVGRPALFRAYRAVQRRVIERADRIVVFTPKHHTGSLQLAAQGIERKIVHVPIGIDIQRLQETPRDEALTASLKQWTAGRPLILSVGRQVYYKGYEFLIEAMSRLRSPAVLLMIGAGPLGARLRRQAEELGLGERVRFIGEVGPRALVTGLEACDVFCLPSVERSEAFGIATAEAMSFGKPTVVCELHNGVTYLNRDGVTSLVTPPRDVARLADALDTLSVDPALRERMGQAARTWVRAEFSIDAMRDGTLALYRSLT